MIELGGLNRLLRQAEEALMRGQMEELAAALEDIETLAGKHRQRIDDVLARRDALDRAAEHAAYVRATGYPFK